MEQKTKITAWLDVNLYKALKSISDRKRLSVSDVVREALIEYTGLSEAKELAKRLKEASDDLRLVVKVIEEYRLPEVRAELKELTCQVRDLKEILNKLMKQVEVICFWSALATELIKTKLFNTRTLTKEEYEQYKKLWNLAHEKADERVESLTGKKVWNKKFNPQV